MKLRKGAGGGGGGGDPFSPIPGAYEDSQYAATASFGISTVPTDASVVWTWSKSGNVNASGSPTSGSASASFSCFLPAASGQFRNATFSVSANKGGTNYGPWTINLTADWS